MPMQIPLGDLSDITHLLGPRRPKLCVSHYITLKEKVFHPPIPPRPFFSLCFHCFFLHLFKTYNQQMLQVFNINSI